ncbi:hypothetical protein ACWD48_29755 [Streptomyces sp. NPDC002519]
MTMTEAERDGAPRLLPWTTEDGRPCFLISDHGDGFLSRRADDVEQVQLAMGSELLGHASEVLEDPKAAVRELRFVGRQLADCLRAALRIAESRGARLGIGADADADTDDEDGDEHAESA